MDESLRNAAQLGETKGLYELIRRDAYVLNRIGKIPFVETPLHIAASTGHTLFATEIMRLKPSFAMKLNQDGFSPMHLALQKLHELENNSDLLRNQVQLVERLLDVDSDIVRVPGKEGVTPFHYVVEMGNLNILTKFSEGCPKAYEDVTIRSENVLHLALKYDKVEVFRRLLGWILQACFKDASSWEKKLPCCKDEEHNTLLHIAVSKNQHEVVSLLLDRGFVDLKAKNLEGETVFNILERETQAKDDNQRIRDMLMPRNYCCLALPSPRKWYEKIRCQQSVIKEDRRNALLVVAALLITVTYQAALSPDKQPNEFNCTTPINATGANQYFNCIASFDASSFEDVFLWCNTTFYLTNLTVAFLLPPDDFLGLVLLILLVILSYGFCFSTPVLNTSILRRLCPVLVLPVYCLPWLTFTYMRWGEHFSSDI